MNEIRQESRKEETWSGAFCLTHKTRALTYTPSAKHSQHGGRHCPLLCTHCAVSLLLSQADPRPHLASRTAVHALA